MGERGGGVAEDLVRVRLFAVLRSVAREQPCRLLDRHCRRHRRARWEGLPAAVPPVGLDDAVPFDLWECFEAERDGTHVVLPVGEPAADEQQRSLRSGLDGYGDSRGRRSGVGAQLAVETQIALGAVDLQQNSWRTPSCHSSRSSSSSVAVQVAENGECWPRGPAFSRARVSGVSGRVTYPTRPASGCVRCDRCGGRAPRRCGGHLVDGWERAVAVLTLEHPAADGRRPRRRRHDSGRRCGADAGPRGEAGMSCPSLRAFVIVWRARSVTRARSCCFVETLGYGLVSVCCGRCQPIRPSCDHVENIIDRRSRDVPVRRRAAAGWRRRPADHPSRRRARTRSRSS